jgi:hypothetical protein
MMNMKMTLRMILCVLITMLASAGGVIHCRDTEQDRFVIITFLYNEKDARRVAEYKECMEKNLKHTAIESIHVLYDTTDDRRRTDDGKKYKVLDYLRKKNVQISYYSSGRPTFQYCLDLANTCYPGKKIILMNADIYFDKTLNRLFEVSLEDRIFACTRWDIRKDMEPLLLCDKDGAPNAMSQDVWIFQTPIRTIECGNLQIGTPHCEKQFALAAHNAGLSLYNPCLSIKCYHLHLSNIRNYRQPKHNFADGIPVQGCYIEDIL